MAHPGRFAKVKRCDYHGMWKGRLYDQKMIKIIYVVENDTAITVTALVYYGQ